ncbi:protein SMALL AUXIN UP-REGULATED RNA 12-like [Bidens hawaiensis]|uniref:protein SMALL AUXIN UP-REGULATED RNA 12-like n=1 Tax=Bidens hawaiensis TaxID=980011 RepID=UPI00404A7525
MKSGNKINQIVRLKQVVNRWRRRVPSSGSLAVYVGSDHRRFVIPTRFLNLPVFVSLLNKAEEEFGFQSSGGLVIPCDVVLFEKLVNVLTADERRFGAYDLDDFAAMFTDEFECSCSAAAACRHATVGDCRSFTPLLKKARV